MNNDTYFNYNYQFGGDVNIPQDYRDTYNKLSEKFNFYNFNDPKGENNIWVSKRNDNVEAYTDFTNGTINDDNDFKEKLIKVLEGRNSVRQSALHQLDTVNTINGDDDNYTLNLDYITNFFDFVYRGKVEKLYYPPELNLKYPDSINVYMEEIEITDKWSGNERSTNTQVTKEGETEATESGKQINHFVFLSNENPCHIAESAKKFHIGRKAKNSYYIFKAGKVLGQGAAGKALLLDWDKKTQGGKLETKQYMALKVMDGSFFNLENKGSHLDIDIIFFDDDQTDMTLKTNFGLNRRYYLNKDKYMSELDNKWDNYTKINVFDSDNGKKCYMAVQSDNFTNQTIVSMILNKVLGTSENFVYQYDAFLCLHYSKVALIQNLTEAQEEYTITKKFKQLFTTITDFSSTMVEKAANKLGMTLENVNINGVTIMEVANQGDIDSFIKKKTISDFKDFSYVSDQKSFNNVKYFFNDMITQILTPLSVLHGSRYAFVHGDMKSKNIFVHINEKGETIYKLADFDKSSITFNGIRFHNSGAAGIKTLRELLFSKITDLKHFYDEEKLKSMGNVRLVDDPNFREDVINDIKQSDITKGDKRYYIKGKIIDASRYGFLSGLEAVEVEQMSVRYIPFPYYQTFDIYTFISSLFFTKLFYIFIKRSYDNDDNKDEEYDDIIGNEELVNQKFQSEFDNKIYMLFKILFDKKDRLTMLKYFEIYYSTETLEDVSINAILDPIKKNYILMLKKYPKFLLNKIYIDFSKNLYENSQPYTDRNLPKKLFISDGFVINGTENVCLTSKPATYYRNFFRGGYTFYVNPINNAVVYNSTDIGEASNYEEYNTVFSKYISSIRSFLMPFKELFNTDIQQIIAKLYKLRSAKKLEALTREQLNIKKSIEYYLKLTDDSDNNKIVIKEYLTETTIQDEDEINLDSINLEEEIQKLKDYIEKNNYQQYKKVLDYNIQQEQQNININIIDYVVNEYTNGDSIINKSMSLQDIKRIIFMDKNIDELINYLIKFSLIQYYRQNKTDRYSNPFISDLKIRQINNWDELNKKQKVGILDYPSIIDALRNIYKYNDIHIFNKKLTLLTSLTKIWMSKQYEGSINIEQVDYGVNKRLAKKFYNDLTKKIVLNGICKVPRYSVPIIGGTFTWDFKSKNVQSTESIALYNYIVTVKL